MRGHARRRHLLQRTLASTECARSKYSCRDGRAAPVPPGRKQIVTQARDSAELASALAQCRTAFIGVAAMSGLVNVLYLTGSFFMLEVYDRVIPSRSRADPGRPLRPGPGALRLPGPARGPALAHPRPDRRRARRDPRAGGSSTSWCARRSRARAPGDGLPAPARPRPDPRLPRRHRAPRPSSTCPGCRSTSLICFLFHPADRRRGPASAPPCSSPSTSSPTGPTRAARPRPPPPTACAATASPRPAAATPRCWPPWACRGASPPAGPRPTATTCSRSSAPPTSPAARRRVEGRSAWRCSPGVLALGAYLVINGQATAGIIIAELDPGGPGPGPGRTRHRQLEGLRPGAPELGPPVRPLRPHARRRAAARAAGAHPCASGRGHQRRPARHPAPRGPGRQLRAPGRPGPRRHRPLAPRASRPWCAPSSGVWPAVRGKVRLDGAALDQWSADDLGPPYRLPAAGGGAVRRHGGGEHRPLRSAGAVRGGDRRRAARPACTS